MPEDRKDRPEKMAKEAKTNAMRMLDRQKVKYEAFSYECDEFIDGISVADKIGLPHEQVYKTLVTVGKSGGHYVFVIPIAAELDLKKAAAADGEKNPGHLHCAAGRCGPGADQTCPGYRRSTGEYFQP